MDFAGDPVDFAGDPVGFNGDPVDFDGDPVDFVGALYSEFNRVDGGRIEVSNYSGSKQERITIKLPITAIENSLPGFVHKSCAQSAQMASELA